MGICNTPGCGATATTVHAFDDGSRYEWCDRCAAEIAAEVSEARELIDAAREIERKLQAEEDR